jgi:NADH:ubiquinone oxidoreductase subunit 4 (subunit M)
MAAFASLGLPGLAHFPAEFQIFLGTFGVWPLAAAITVIGILVTAGLYLRPSRSRSSANSASAAALVVGLGLGVQLLLARIE